MIIHLHADGAPSGPPLKVVVWDGVPAPGERVVVGPDVFRAVRRVLHTDPSDGRVIVIVVPEGAP